MSEDIKNCISQFFIWLEIEFDELNTTLNEDKNIVITKIQSTESGLLIWPHGKNLDCIQWLIRQMINKDSEVRYKFRLDVNDYESSKDERLFSFIQSKINEVKKTGIDCKLPFYSPYERKKIHSYVADLKDDSFYTQSRGEDKDRRLFICKQEKKLTIDFDGDDI